MANARDRRVKIPTHLFSLDRPLRCDDHAMGAERHHDGDGYPDLVFNASAIANREHQSEWDTITMILTQLIAWMVHIGEVDLHKEAH